MTTALELSGPPAREVRELGGYVDPMVGTAGGGNSNPGPQLPHGMIKPGPDSLVEGGELLRYEYNDERLAGFSHPHLQGPAGSGYGYNHVLVTPVVGKKDDDSADVSSAFSHENESAAPGYYTVVLDDPGVKCELTASHRSALHRYTFPASDESEFRIDLGHTGGKCVDAHVEFVEPNVVRGWGNYAVFPLLSIMGRDKFGSSGMRTLYFHAEFDRPFEYTRLYSPVGGVAAGAAIATAESLIATAGFTTTESDVVQMKLAISLISPEQAESNLGEEIPEWDFAGVRSNAEAAWNEALNTVIVDGEEDEKRVFYSALYRSMLEPVDYTEGDRFWLGPGTEGLVREAAGRRFYADDWCIWDTFRTSHPLHTLIEPELCSDVVHSYLLSYEEGGWLPKCPWQATGYSRMMIGNHAVPVIVDMYRKGYRDFDVDLAYEAMRKSAMEDSIDPAEWPGMCGYPNLGTPPEYVQGGFVSHECDETQSVSMTLEYAYDDWALGMMAQDLGLSQDAEYFLARAMNYEEHWNPAVGFMQARHKNGTWVEPFDPESEVDFCEADSWKYTWFVPHDVEGLMELIGGAAAFEQKLDDFFAGDHYTADNQPDFHVPFLYNFAGVPWKTQELVRSIALSEYGADPGGLPGNDDAGSTSAWYLFAAMGFYPLCPGANRYEITTPLFEKVVLRLSPEFQQGEAFVIVAAGLSDDNIYINSMTLNGEPLDRYWLSHDEIIRGGELVLNMGSAKR